MRVVLLLFLLLFGVACAGSPPEPAFVAVQVTTATTGPTATATVAPTPSPTADLAPEPTAEATPIPTSTPTPLAEGWLAGPKIDYEGVAFTLDPVLGTAVYPTRLRDEMVLVQFGQNEDSQCQRQPFCLTVYDATAYRNMLWHGDWLLDLVTEADG
jgi:hypothetical protein